MDSKQDTQRGLEEMTYSLPFGLKQKPLPHYFEHGVIKFAMREGVMHYTIKKITKSVNATLLTGEVKSKAHLDKLLSIKNLSEIPTIEVVA